MTSTPARRRPPLPYPVGWFGALFYAGVIKRINRRFDAGRGVVTLDRPVISIGNLSVGGTGKTPMVMHVLRTLLDAGHKPCVAMRGYASVNGRSDEAEEVTRAFPSVPVVARADRTAGLIELFGSPRGEQVDCIVLDDGFQHRRLARQLDVVLIDATRSPFRDELLPAGWLREPVGGLRRAQAVVITHAESAPAPDVTALARQVRDLAPDALPAVTRHMWSALRVQDADGEREESVSWLHGKSVVAACAIGNPVPFIASVRTATGREVEAVVLRDHDPFHRATVENILRRLASTHAAALVVTEKDWSKLRRLPAGTWPCPVVRPRLSLRFDQGEAELSALVKHAAQLNMDS